MTRRIEHVAEWLLLVLALVIWFHLLHVGAVAATAIGIVCGFALGEYHSRQKTRGEVPKHLTPRWDYAMMAFQAAIILLVLALILVLAVPR